jgi:hypothetical protein
MNAPSTVIQPTQLSPEEHLRQLESFIHKTTELEFRHRGWLTMSALLLPTAVFQDCVEQQAVQRELNLASVVGGLQRLAASGYSVLASHESLGRVPYPVLGFKLATEGGYQALIADPPRKLQAILNFDHTTQLELFRTPSH